jgi:hypothetical protein
VQRDPDATDPGVRPRKTRKARPVTPPLEATDTPAEGTAGDGLTPVQRWNTAALITATERRERGP